MVCEDLYQVTDCPQQGNFMGTDGANTVQQISPEPSEDVPSYRNILQSPWFRCSFFLCDEVDRKLLDYRRYILWASTIIFWFLLYLVS